MIERGKLSAASEYEGALQFAGAIGKTNERDDQMKGGLRRWMSGKLGHWFGRLRRLIIHYM